MGQNQNPASNFWTVLWLGSPEQQAATSSSCPSHNSQFQGPSTWANCSPPTTRSSGTCAQSRWGNQPPYLCCVLQQTSSSRALDPKILSRLPGQSCFATKNFFTQSFFSVLFVFPFVDKLYSDTSQRSKARFPLRTASTDLLVHFIGFIMLEPSCKSLYQRVDPCSDCDHGRTSFYSHLKSFQLEECMSSEVTQMCTLYWSKKGQQQSAGTAPRKAGPEKGSRAGQTLYKVHSDNHRAQSI